jgi:hypothetical protein
MSNYIVCIPTCNRPEMAKGLSQIYQEGRTFFFVNNCDPKQYDVPGLVYTGIHKQNKLEALYLTTKLIIETAAKLQETPNLYVIEDDTVPTPEFLQWMETYDYLDVINLLNISGRDAYFYAGPYRRPRLPLVDTWDRVTWVDGNFMIPAEYVKLVAASMPNKRPGLSKSSGIGHTLSRIFGKYDIPIFQPKKSFLKHGTHESILFPKGRKLHPLISNAD